ncbi:hypothetical protein HPB48_023395 [Haemaphysalis longicornis]|uniref:Hcy-binding domain-containing protein n=1 Tax=Haemaphysalis longicornis TaxID=44386 RepID=A0A9J6H6V8_HAELO|nr:hypothetical protein HPB48_023395 [Haemaphysalis longicornis]
MGISASDAESLIARSCEAAMRAREESRRPSVLVAGSVGSYGAALSDFSEYTVRGEFLPLRETHPTARPRGECLATVMSACHAADSSGQICAVGANCLPSRIARGDIREDRAVAHSLRRLSEHPGSPLAAYVSDWMKLNVGLIGGCCRTGPDDIRDIAGVMKRGDVEP